MRTKHEVKVRLNKQYGSTYRVETDLYKVEFDDQGAVYRQLTRIERNLYQSRSMGKVQAFGHAQKIAGEYKKLGFSVVFEAQ